MIKKKLFVRSYSKKSAPKRPLVNAYNDRCFWVHNGPVLSNLRDLLRAFNSMTDKQFEQHVAKDKNDFAVWTEQVLQDPECAADLRKASSRKKSITAVEEALNKYLV